MTIDGAAARALARLVLVVTACCALASTAGAQPGRVGIGAQVGAPAGLTARILLASRAETRSSFNALVLQATFDPGDSYLFQAYVTRELHVRRSPISFFAGPGAFVGWDGDRRPLGVGAVAGVHFYKSRFEVHFQAAPRMEIGPDWRLRMGAGVGLRYYP